MADGKAGEEKPEKPQRAGAAGGEHNPSVAGYVGCSEPFFEPPGVGGVDWGENGRIWLSPGHGASPGELLIWKEVDRELQSPAMD